MEQTNAAAVKEEKYETQKIALKIAEEKKYNSRVLDTKNAVIDYDILVWTNETGLVFEKSGRTSKEKLQETLTFDAPLDVIHYIILDLSVIINGKKYPFLTLSPYDKILFELIKNTGHEFKFESKPYFVPTLKGTQISTETKYDSDLLPSNQFPLQPFPKEGNGDVRPTQPTPLPFNLSLIFQTLRNVNEECDRVRNQYVVDPNLTEEENNILLDQAIQNVINEVNTYNSNLQQLWDNNKREADQKGYLEIPMYIIEQEIINTLVKNTIGKILIDVDSVVDNIDDLSLRVKLENKQIDIRKKQSLSPLFVTEQESIILETIKKERLYRDLIVLLKAYQTSGVANLSDYRLNIYKSLKGAVDNLIALKGKLENFGPTRDIPKGGADEVASDKF